MEEKNWKTSRSVPGKSGREIENKREGSPDACWGFCAVVCCTLGVAAFLVFSAWGKFDGVAWGGAVEVDAVPELEASGFIAVDMSDFDLSTTQVGLPPEVAGLKEAAESVSSDLTLRIAPDVLTTVADVPELPKPESLVASLPLPLPAVEVGDVADFGPLPKDLSDFESIILSTEDDGTKLPDDGTEDISEMELPEADLQLEEVGAEWREHVVKAGETLSDIALSFGGVTTQDIIQANGLKDANRLMVNQILLVPRSPKDVEATHDEVRTRQMRVAALREATKPLSTSVYVVAMGDSLWSIANAQNLELDTLMGSNTFKSGTTLKPGMKLRVPNQDGIFYTIKKGDKLELVCKRYQVDMGKLRKVNPTLDLVSLKVGSEVFLPGARPEALADVKVEGKKTKVSSVTHGGSAPARGGRSYRWPVMGRITSPFGWRRHPVTRRRDFHTGIDIKANRGDVIRAARDGRVAYSGWMGGYGKVLVIEHSGGQSTLYAHCSALLVAQGTKITQGQNVARVGTTGRSTGPHLHFEVRRDNKPVNPLPYLK